MIGVIYVFNEFLVGDDLYLGKIKGVLFFDDVYDLYSSVFEVEMSVFDRINIRDELFFSEIGLFVIVFIWKNVSYIVFNLEKLEYCKIVRCFL